MIGDKRLLVMMKPYDEMTLTFIFLLKEEYIRMRILQQSAVDQWNFTVVLEEKKNHLIHSIGTLATSTARIWKKK